MEKGTRYNQMSHYQRLRMKDMLDQGMPKVKIAEKLGVNRSTIFNEIKRGTVNGEYDPEYAEMRAQDNYLKSGKKSIIGSDKRLAAYISYLILNYHYSPEKVVEYLKDNGTEFEKIPHSPVTIYDAIDRGMIPDVTRENRQMKSDTITVSSKGIRVPLWLIKENGIKNGETFRVECRENGDILLKKEKVHYETGNTTRARKKGNTSHPGRTKIHCNYE